MRGTAENLLRKVINVPVVYYVNLNWSNVDAVSPGNGGATQGTTTVLIGTDWFNSSNHNLSYPFPSTYYGPPNDPNQNFSGVSVTIPGCYCQSETAGPVVYGFLIEVYTIDKNGVRIERIINGGGPSDGSFYSLSGTMHGNKYWVNLIASYPGHPEYWVTNLGRSVAGTTLDNPLLICGFQAEVKLTDWFAGYQPYVSLTTPIYNPVFAKYVWTNPIKMVFGHPS